ncbi:MULTISPECIES: CDP-diacylglycerol--glycerol-3-phosphate 3-phosphatidyltransferase [Cryobacterium]|uniref:CDP-diacylglycerol--glycerol-3-phosphate 3-phosphatidyltransferase n=1 Tax=Cryobacterium breve TaxID=1259258 RepID=A0ABY2JCC2_9MICO|nr:MULTISPECIES: CDP-diacylglycerol--glycerol-3-phosphate 3-phosphatidyltransferase [Cryobacterium]TFC97799.1 CDP-diacylglycerol--glycerol-3-phosphate 3-phosphatidyltransferase [Cryobacterium sp. TmT3-12]TFD01547.1 CDP-diacylglycerol--glycerol-3-phosphate 3-phosphatidyltransferase [Cryobacterium breve]
MATPSTPVTRPSNWNLPNLITVVRILLAPLFIWMLLADAGQDGALRWWAAALFIVAIATDGIDGAIARRHNLVTDLGKILDPIADKVLTGSALICLSILGELWWWVTVVILVREIGITVFRFVMLRDRVIPASRGGKLKTLLQSVAISLALLPLWLVFGEWIYWVSWTAMALALMLTVITGIDYLVAARRENRRRQDHD